MTAGATPWRRDKDELAQGLAEWVELELGARLEPHTCALPANGMANETILFEAGGEGFVVRLAPDAGSPYPTFPVFDLGFQRDCMDLVRHRTSVPVPEVVRYEEDPAWLGTPFLVMRRIEGDIPGDSPPYVLDSWMTALDDGDLARLEEATIRELAAIHSVRDPADLAHVGGPSGSPALEHLLAGQRDYYEWAREGRRVPAVEAALDVLGATVPANDRVVLNWGDSRIGNIIYRDCRPVGILDWEMAGTGPAEVDVGWMVFMHRFMQEMVSGAGFPGLPEFLRRERVVALYERFSGTRLDDLAWYEAFAGLRFAIILLRMGLRAASFGQAPPPADDDSLIMFAPLLRGLVADVASDLT